mgnify:CR=1 FL=1
MTMKPSPDDEMPAAPETGSGSGNQESRGNSRPPETPPVRAAASPEAPADRVKETGDAEGEALLEVLKSERPLTPEEVPNIFAPEEQAALRAAWCENVPGPTPPGNARPAEPAFSVPESDPAVEARPDGEKQRTENAWTERARAGQRSDASRSSASAGPAGAPPINPRWGSAAGTGVTYSSGGAGTPPGGAGGAWVWLPEGMKPPKSWPKRHPILFWGACIVILMAVFTWGRKSVEDGPLVGPRIAVINVEGIIMDASATVAWIEKVRRDPSIKGAILRVNSPGGAVGPSQEIYAAVKRLDETKPVVASMGALAASGGYYVSLGARQIYASPSTLTASIGVKMQMPNFEGLMKSIGISEMTLTTGKLKDAGSSWRPMTPEEESYLRNLIGDMYEQFIQTVSQERALPLDAVRQLADGRAMTGRQAVEVKLVDTLGDQYEALRRVLDLCGLEESPQLKLVEGPEKPGASLLKELISGVLDIGMEYKNKAEQPVFMY